MKRKKTKAVDGEVFETFIVTLTGEFGGEQDFRNFNIEERVTEKHPDVTDKWVELWDSAASIVNKRTGKKKL